MTSALSARWPLMIAAACLMAACSNESEDMPETLLPDRGEDKIIEGTGRPERIVRDPTPESGSDTTIPGYEPADAGEFDVDARPDVGSEWAAPAGRQATPIVYEVDGRQYLAMMAGGHTPMETPLGDAVMAWSLPGNDQPGQGSTGIRTRPDARPALKPGASRLSRPDVD